MEIWLDSINFDLVKKANGLGILHGVTTNPAILAESSDREKCIKNLLELQSGPVTYQVTASSAKQMILQGLAFKAISDRLIVKIPVTQEGLNAIHVLSQKGIQTMATVIFDFRQYLLAAKAGAHYAAPYYSAILKAGGDADSQITRMCKLKERHHLPTKILGASFQSIEQIEACIDLGVDAVTIKDVLFLDFIADHKETLHRMDLFQQAWNREL